MKQLFAAIPFLLAAIAHGQAAPNSAAFYPATAFDVAGAAPCSDSARGIFHPSCYTTTGAGTNALVTQADAAFNAAVAYTTSNTRGAVVSLDSALWPVCNNQQGWILPHGSGSAGVSIAGASQVGSVLTLSCAIARTALPAGSQSGSPVSQSFVWEPVPALFSLTSYHMHDFGISANQKASACMDMEGTTYVSKFENIVCNGATGDGSATANAMRFGNSAYPNLSWSFQVFLDNISITSGGNAGTGATLTAAATSGSPTFTINAGGAGYGVNTQIILNGMGAGSKPCATMGVLTPTISSGAITGVTASGFAGCTGTLYAQVYDNVTAVKYGLFLDRYTDSTAVSLQPQVGSVAALYIVGGNNNLIKSHPCCSMPVGAIDAGTNTWDATEFDSIGNYSMVFQGGSASTMQGSQFYWNGSFPGAGGYLFAGAGAVTLIGGKCNNLQSAGGYNQIASGATVGLLPANVSLVGEQECAVGAVQNLFGQAISAPVMAGGNQLNSGLQFKPSTVNGGTGNLVFYGASGTSSFAVVPSGDAYFGSYASAPARSLYFYQGSNGTAGCASGLVADYNQLYFTQPCGGNLLGLGSGATVNVTTGATKLPNLTLTGSLVTTLATPATSTATCIAGQQEVDANYVYVCTAASTWKRAALTAF